MFFAHKHRFLTDYVRKYIAFPSGLIYDISGGYNLMHTQLITNERGINERGIYNEK